MVTLPTGRDGATGAPGEATGAPGVAVPVGAAYMLRYRFHLRLPVFKHGQPY